MRDLLRLNTHGENGDFHLNGTDDKRSPFQAAEKLYAFAEAEPKSLQHKRLVEKTIGLYTSFKLLFPSALPCIDPFTGIAYNEGDELEGKQVARPGDRYAGCTTFSLEVFGHDIHAGDNHEVLFRGTINNEDLSLFPLCVCALTT